MQNITSEKKIFTLFQSGSLKRKSRLAWKFMCINGALILSLSLIQMIFLTIETKRSLRSDFIENTKDLTLAQCSAVVNRIGQFQNEMHMYSKSSSIVYGTKEEIIENLRSQVEDRSKDFNYILYAESDGMASSDIGEDVDIHDRPYFTAIMKDGKDEYIDDPVLSRMTGKGVFHIAQAVKRNDRTYAVVVGVIDIGFLENFTSTIKFGKTGYAWVLGSDGTIIAHPTADYIMKKNLITGFSQGQNDLTAVAQKMSKGETGYSIIRNLHRDKDLVCYAPIAGTPWSMAITVEDSQINSTALKLTHSMIITMIIILISLSALSGIFLIAAFRPLQIVGKTITNIASGNADLTQRIQLKSDNEIGEVVNGFNEFTEKLQSIVVELKKSKGVLAAAGESLHTGTQDTAAAMNQILSNIEDMNSHITNQASGVEETASAVNEIASNIQSLEHMIETQASGVSQASAAVEEMIGNINSVNQSVEKMAASFLSLEKNAADGSSKQQDVNERIEQIESESEMLQEANTAIASIASQTNLLAMNAAIEAAHAGEAGKGFSVVADEIRKLSETSSAQSKTIGDQLTKIKDSINGVVTASADSSTAFTAVTAGIKQTDELVRQIKAAMQEQQEGSKQINDALHSMNNSTVEVRNASAEMSAGNKAILEEVKSLQDSTVSMKESMSQMRSGAGKISSTGKELTDISGKLKDSIQNIGDQIDLFKV